MHRAYQTRHPHGGFTQRQTSTGILECLSTLLVSLPNNKALAPLRPCEAMKIGAQPWVSAAWRMSS
ncbi:hypothetical protein MIZ03_3079 [Rhodoferax lithotrophicus]|uniref:Uncharacterized protein n=1 Tax=Rhodoferax lithotrophicus TaxID=2798804 RepID=A0ABM7MPD9_9BURK|nr:hypothetical protein MIZ03_3079 [Rhodoferax sp. MIZ03]